MVMIACLRHGLSNVAFVSPDLVGAVNAQQKINFLLKKFRVEILGFGESSWVDVQFAQKFKLSDLEGDILTLPADSDEAFSAWGALSPVCISCYQEFLQLNGLLRPWED